MLRVRPVQSEGQVWLNFVDHDSIPAVGIQFPRNSPPGTPFNLFWWGYTNPKQLVGFFSRLVSSAIDFSQAPSSFVRVIQYGPNGEDVGFIETERVIYKSDELSLELEPELALIRLELHLKSGTAPLTDVKMKSSSLIVWARPNQEPDISDPEEAENVGIFIQPSTFSRNRNFIQKFIEETSQRPVRPSEFNSVVAGIREVIPAL